VLVVRTNPGLSFFYRNALAVAVTGNTVPAGLFLDGTMTKSLSQSETISGSLGADCRFQAQPKRV